MSDGKKASRHLLAGFTGGLTSSVCLQPLDLLKTRVQQSPDASVLSVFKQIKSIKQLWRGTLPSALRTSVGSALYLTSLNGLRTKISQLKVLKDPNFTNHKSSSSLLPVLSPTENLLTGMFARGFVGFLTMPITVVKVRFESDRYNYKTMAESFKGIYKDDGIKGFFRGFGATCLRDAPYAGLYVLFYEQLKEFGPMIIAQRNKSDHLSTSEQALINSASAVMAASCATTITAPFDTIKTNMQVDPKRFSSFTKTVKYLVGHNWKRLFDGLSLRLGRKAMSAGIAWGIYEELVKL